MGEKYQPISEAENLATDFVSQVEWKYLAGLLVEALREKRRAESCGCRTCIVGYNKAEQAFNIEKFRIDNPHQIDEEEALIASYGKVGI